MTDTVTEVGTISVAAVRRDGGTQSRAGLDEAIVSEYMDVMREHGPFKFPTIKVVFDGTNYWLVDGFHRHEAALRLGVLQLPVEVVQGTQRDAVLMSTGVNADHGLRRTNADKRRAVETLLRDPEWGKWSDREIARLTATSNRFVGNVRVELEAVTPTGDSVNESQTPDDVGKTRTVQRGGKTFEMKTGKIGADKRDGQGADTWALIERGAWKFRAGIYYAVDQKHKVIYFAGQDGGPITAAKCAVIYPGCLAVSGAGLNSDWETYRAAGYTFKSPSEFTRPPSSFASDKFPMEWYVTDYDASSGRSTVYVPGFDTLPEAEAFNAQIHSGSLSHHSAMKQYERAKLIQRDSIGANGNSQPVNEQFIGLTDGYYYLVHDGNKAVWNKPMSYQEASSECLKIRAQFGSLEGDGFSVISGMELKKHHHFANYRLVLGFLEVPTAKDVSPWHEQSRFRVGLAAVCHKCAKNFGKSDGHAEWEPTETPKLWRCKRCRGRTSDALMKIEGQVTVPATEQAAGEADARPGTAFVWASGQWSEMGVSEALQLAGLQPVEAQPVQAAPVEAANEPTGESEATSPLETLPRYQAVAKRSIEAARILRQMNTQYGYDAAVLAMLGMGKLELEFSRAMGEMNVRLATADRTISELKRGKKGK